MNSNDDDDIFLDDDSNEDEIPIEDGEIDPTNLLNLRQRWSSKSQEKPVGTSVDRRRDVEEVLDIMRSECCTRAEAKEILKQANR